MGLLSLFDLHSVETRRREALIAVDLGGFQRSLPACSSQATRWDFTVTMWQAASEVAWSPPSRCQGIRWVGVWIRSRSGIGFRLRFQGRGESCLLWFSSERRGVGIYSPPLSCTCFTCLNFSELVINLNQMNNDYSKINKLTATVSFWTCRLFRYMWQSQKSRVADHTCRSLHKSTHDKQCFRHKSYRSPEHHQLVCSYSSARIVEKSVISHPALHT